MRGMVLGCLLLATGAAHAAEIRIDGPAGPLGGVLLAPEGARQIVVIVPGSGPTDRDGNSPKGLRTDAYKMLAQGLSGAGIASIRVDKRGMFTSASDGLDPNRVTVAGLSQDVQAWAAEAAKRAGTTCAWVLGHSEGGLMALVAAQDQAAPICGLVLVAAPGRRLGLILREQLKANPANAPILDGALEAIDALERGQYPSFAIWDLTLRRLFPKSVHDFIIDLFAQDPAGLIAAIKRPVLIVQGTRDLQISQDDANALKAAKADAVIRILTGMTHTLKAVDSDGRAANAATYTDPALPLHPRLVPAISAFLQDHLP